MRTLIAVLLIMGKLVLSTSPAPTDSFGSGAEHTGAPVVLHGFVGPAP
jgi:hypothetical protein